MKSQRQLQMGETIKRTIADFFLREDLFSFKNSYITILEADVSPDIKNVKIYIDIFGNDTKHEEIINKLNHNAPHFRFLLAKTLKNRVVPEVTFVLDKTESKAANLEKIIHLESQKFNQVSKKPRKKS